MDYIKQHDAISKKPDLNLPLEESFIFPTAIYHLKAASMPETVSRKNIVDFILKRRIIDPGGRVKSNRLGWQSRDLVEDSLKSPDLISLWDTVLDCTKAIAAKQSLSDQYEFFVGSAWANINQAHNQYNVSHCHPGTYYAAIYYVQCGPGSGDLVINDPRPAASFSLPHNSQDDPIYNMPSINMAPVEGDLVLMPGWLMHAVLGNDGDDAERLVIASNVVIR